MSISKFLFIILISLGLFSRAYAQAIPEVEWYPPETEKSRIPERSKVVISGRTLSGSLVQIDGDSVTVIKASGPSRGSRKIESRSTLANFEGFFEIAIDLPQGLVQIPILVTSPARAKKTFMISVNVSINVNKVDDIKMNTKISRNKPPAAAKKVRLWFGAGLTYQGYAQAATGAPGLAFQTIQAPGIVGRGGYWGDRWGVDFYFRDAPGKIEAVPPFQVQSNTYHWQTMEAKGLYQFDRGPDSRIGGLPSQWQLRFGAELQQVPFLDINNANVVAIQEGHLVMTTLGMGLLLGQEQDWSYEFALGLQYPLSASGPGTSFSVSSPFGYEAQLGAAYKFAPNWRLGLFSYTQSLNYSYGFQNSSGVTSTGKQSLYYTTFDLRLGYEF